ncbi:hypothetical protein WH95_19545 [Kiloniella litopenaei]|uniref:Lipoprotein n=1 Tax=Kiloniella litopenaei TaxID=1549748 RepID=A0A0M2R5G3_9PROT|nr:hypothetical protein WH95_19545 [Kiloniella litopenaei]
MIRLMLIGLSLFALSGCSYFGESTTKEVFIPIAPRPIIYDLVPSRIDYRPLENLGENMAPVPEEES